jgi:hypothetical protein
MAHDPHTKATLAQAQLIGQLNRSSEPGAAALAAVPVIMIAMWQGEA